jgi:hypothetical protein
MIWAKSLNRWNSSFTLARLESAREYGGRCRGGSSHAEAAQTLRSGVRASARFGLGRELRVPQAGRRAWGQAPGAFFAG